jgi:hypothetical protein
MVVKDTKIFYPKAFQNEPKLAFLVLKCNVWQPRTQERKNKFERNKFKSVFK